MGRKLKGKIGTKNLKNALLRQQTKVITKVKDQGQRHLSKDGLNKKKQKSFKIGFIPFERDSTLLLIGEGDLSFAKSIIEKNLIQSNNLIVTSFDNGINELSLKYPHSAQANYDFLLSLGVKIFFCIDGTDLIKAFKLSKNTPWVKVMGPEWNHKHLDNIMFNFPHTGSGIKDQERNIKRHQELLFKFFESCRRLFTLVNNFKVLGSNNSLEGYMLHNDSTDGSNIQSNESKVILSLFSGEPYESWNVKLIAKNNDWRLERSHKFEWENYPGYHHKRTNSEKDTTKPALERDARVYIFAIHHRNRITKGNELDDTSDSKSRVRS